MHVRYRHNFSSPRWLAAFICAALIVGFAPSPRADIIDTAGGPPFMVGVSPLT